MKNDIDKLVDVAIARRKNKFDPISIGNYILNFLKQQKTRLTFYR